MQINFEVSIFKLKVYIANLIPMCELMIVESTTKAQGLVPPWLGSRAGTMQGLVPPWLGSRAPSNASWRALLLIEAWPLPRQPGIGRALKRHPFSGLVDSAGELLHTP